MSKQQASVDVLTGNKIISVFDGMQIGALSGWMSGNVGEKAYRKVDGEVTEVYSFDKLKYHSSWDWLMPACFKFDTLEITGRKRRIYESHCDVIDAAVSRYEIIPVFEALVDGITWYNNTQTKKQ